MTRKVLYNLNSIRAPITGIGRYAIELLRGSHQTELPVSVAHGGKLYTEHSLPTLFKQLEVQPKHSVQWRQMAGHIPFIYDLYRKIDSDRFHRLVSSELDSHTLHHDINYSLKTLSIPRVSTVYDLSHRYYPETHPQHRIRFLNRYFEQLSISQEPIITISNSVKSELIQTYSIAPERIHVTHLAADNTFYPRTQADCHAVLDQYGLEYKQYVLCVGALEPRKNIQRVLSAYCALDVKIKNSFPLVLAGPYGWKCKKLATQIDQLNRQGLVKNIGFLPQEFLPIFYAGASVFVYPSLYEGFGLPLLEAMQSGCACLTSNSGALAEISADNALHVDPLNTEHISSQLGNLLHDVELNAHYALAGQLQAKHFSWQNVVAKTHAVYDSI